MIVKVFNTPNKLPKCDLPKNILDHCNQYKDKYIKQASLFVWSCLDKYIELSKVKFSKNGKPIISSKKYLSLSHSLNMVAIAVSNKPVGIDIETIIPFTIVRSLAQRLLNNKELALYHKAKDQCLWFTKYWTQHEAYIKLLGENVTFSSFNQKIKGEVTTKQIIGKDKRTYLLSVVEKK